MGDIVKYDTKTAGQIQAVLSECSLKSIINLAEMERAFVAAAGVSRLREMLTDRVIETVFMSLQGSQLGFVTDKDRERGYPVAVVRECLIAALMNGVYATGNEFNIISGRMYITKNGMGRLVREFPGVTNVVLEPGVPHVKEGGALVSYRVTWDMHGEPRELVCSPHSEESPGDTRIPVKVNTGMGLDAILGKAERKVLARVYSQLLGAAVPDGEVDDVIEGSVNKPKGKASRSASSDLLGPTLPDHLSHLKPLIDECKTYDAVMELCDKHITDPDDLEPVLAYGKELTGGK